MRSLVAFLILPCAVGAERIDAHLCNFTTAPRMSATESTAIRSASVDRQWRGMTDEYWVSYEVSATFPQFASTSTPAAARLNRVIRDYVENHLYSIRLPYTSLGPALDPAVRSRLEKNPSILSRKMADV